MVRARRFDNAEEILEIPISYEDRGKEKGRKEGKKEVALEMLQKGMDLSLIVEVTRLSLQDVEDLKSQL